MQRWPRVAYFPDSFHEVNGVAHTSRQFEHFARTSHRPFLCVRAGARKFALSARLDQQDSVTTLELPRGFASFALDKDLSFDPLYFRHTAKIKHVVRQFAPDLIHITGPSELGMIGAGIAHTLRIPLVASWHTNVHEYAGRRAASILRILPSRARRRAIGSIEDTSLFATAKFYRLADLLFAPNKELVEMLQKITGKPCELMQRGIDTDVFHPGCRRREPGDDAFVLGYVGRLSVEKNIEVFKAMDETLRRTGRPFRFLMVGQGRDEQWLKQQLPGAEFTGVLRGGDLARAYANMDMFVFPSKTDTFGNVVLEALASGVPALVTEQGGPKFLVSDGVTGFIRPDTGFAEAAELLMRNPELQARMREQARASALETSWEAVFERVYASYLEMLSLRSPAFAQA